eukprot:GHVU01185792.1.p1 GENE.GHVU01185792.1~~GHVU01185792.1.p1  ORF type:complete len:388 (+),score=-3.76 GHVU01185792.1:75-1238(+)
MAQSRTRTSKDFYSHPGTWQRYWPNGSTSGSLETQLSYPGRKRLCSDYLDTSSPIGDEIHALDLIEFKTIPLVANGKAGYDKFSRYTMHMGHIVDFHIHGEHSDLPPQADWDYWFTKAVANMNPNKPIVDLPLYLYELKDLPRIIKGALDIRRRGLKVKDGPEAYLAYNFGIGPLLSDLKSLFDFAESFDNRLKYLRGLEKGKRIKRTLAESSKVVKWVTLDPYIQPVKKINYVPSTFYERAWFTARPSLQGTIPDLGPVERLKKDAFGAGQPLTTIWNSIPWTWLLDYLGNIGDFLAASDGRIRWDYHTIVCMHESHSSVQFPKGQKVFPSCTLQGGSCVTTRKQRAFSSDFTPRFSWNPVLSNRQEGILGALITARLLGGSGYRS